MASRVTPTSRRTLQLFGHYQAGYLPFAGPVTDQPAWLMEAFAVVANNRDED